MNAPLQVQRAAERADQLVAQQNHPASPTETPPDPAAPPANPESPPQDLGSEVARLQAELAKSEQRYRTARGMHDADRARFSTQIQDLQEQMQSLQTRQAPPAAPAPAPQPATAGDVEEFGPETVDFVTRVATNVVNSLAPQIIESILSARLAPVSERVEQVTHHVQRSAEQVFVDEFSKLVPDWQNQNSDPDFLNWLQEVNPVAGVPTQALLTDARGKLDHIRCAAIFNMYRQLSGVAAPRQQSAPAVDERQMLVEPARTASAAPAAPGARNTQTISRVEIAKFYADVRAGRISGPEAQRREQEIFLAQSQGRVAG